MIRIKKNDIVMIMKGRDRGKTGRVMKILSAQMKGIIEGRNLVKKHSRKSQKNPQGGIMQMESPMQVCNLMPVCPKCNKPVRVGSIIEKDGRKSRVCKKCKEALA
jgi:large subunit ribosomal protein L24